MHFSEENDLTLIVNFLASALSGGLSVQHEGIMAGSTSGGLNSSLRSFPNEQENQYTPNSSAFKAYQN